jgi:hypothetical protein
MPTVLGHGAEWTYEGAGPVHLALALLANHLVDDQAPVRRCDRFMREVVAQLDNAWRLTSSDIDQALGPHRPARLVRRVGDAPAAGLAAHWRQC